MVNQSCNSQNTGNNIPSNDEYQTVSEMRNFNSSVPWSEDHTAAKEFRAHYIPNLMYYIALPVDWVVSAMPHTGTEYIKGPNGISVFSTPFENYYFDCSPLMIQTARINGWTVTQPVPLEDIVEQTLMPRIESQGGKLLKTYSLPELESRDRALCQLVKQSNGFQDLGLNMLATEWINSDGQRSLILLTQSITRSNKGFSMWTLALEELTAPESGFENARQVYVDALTNKKYNEQQIITAGRLRRAGHEKQLAANEARANEMLRQNAIAHQNRMRSNEATFQATQKSHRDAYNTASELSMQGYWNRSHSSYRSQADAVNGIHEERTIINPFDNQPIQIREGFKRTFVDPFGNTFQTNDMLMNQGQYPELQHYREIR